MKGGKIMSNIFVVCMGLGTVFFGLICIILLCYVMSYFVQKLTTPKEAPMMQSTTTTTTIENREELVAAISVAIAEDLGTDVSAIRILSIKSL